MMMSGGGRKTLASVVGLALLVVAGVTRLDAESATLTLSYPTQVGDLAFSERRDPNEQVHSTQLVYKAPGMTLTLYIFGGGSELPDGVESPQFTKQFEMAKEAIHDPRAWKRVKQVHEGDAELGVAPSSIPAREAVFNVRSEDSKATSYLYLAAAGHVFFKVRYTGDVEREVLERNAAAIRSAVGEIIHKAVHRE